jgi:hypothetical protein
VNVRIEADVTADLFGVPLPFAQLFLGTAKGLGGTGHPLLTFCSNLLIVHEPFKFAL